MPHSTRACRSAGAHEGLSSVRMVNLAIIAANISRRTRFEERHLANVVRVCSWWKRALSIRGRSSSVMSKPPRRTLIGVACKFEKM